MSDNSAERITEVSVNTFAENKVSNIGTICSLMLFLNIKAVSLSILIEEDKSVT